ncbi:MAG: VTC domain-containing protein [Allomuricauda sp.]
MVKVVDNVAHGPAYHNLRFERKFVYPNAIVDDVINNEVLTNSFGFREIFHKRTVNNIYFDDWSHTFYKMNISGDGKREKLRLRWYGDAFYEVKAPTLEIKKKYGEVGDKYSHKIKNLEFDLRLLPIDKLSHFVNGNIDDKSLLSKMELLFPTLFNSYERRYFLSDCEKFRITIDYNMVFYNPNSNPYYLTESKLEDIILELKYNTADDMESREITQSLTERLSKNSKYVRGYDILYH